MPAERSNPFTRAQRKVKADWGNKKLDAHEAVAGTVAGVAGFKTGSYVRGARALKNFSPEQAKRVSENLNRSGKRETDLFNIAGDPKKMADPTYLYRDRAKAYKKVKNTSDPADKKPLKHIKRASDLWADTHGGVKDARRAAAGKKGPGDVLRFNHRPKHQMMSRVVENSGEVDYPLYRGMAMKGRPKVGDEFDLDQSSWTDRGEVADLFSRNMSSGAGKRMARKRGGGDTPVKLEMTRGRATNISNMTRTVQGEHVAPKGRYRVVEERGGSVRVEQVKKNDPHAADPFGITEIAKKQLSQDQIDRKKKIQSATSISTATLGLTALGAQGVKSGLPRAAAAMSRATKRPVNARKVEAIADKADKVRTPLLTAGAGIGGVGGYNFASYTKAEAEQKKKPVPVSKAGDWKTIDQRERTQRRDRKAMSAAGGAAGTGAALVAAGYASGDDKVVNATGKKLKYIKHVGKLETPFSGRKILSNKEKAKWMGRTVKEGVKASTPSTKTGLALIGGAAAVGGAAKGQHTYQQHKINQRRRKRASRNVRG